MFINEAKKQFYKLIQTKHSRVLIFVSYDVDAIAACRIIQFLFETDNIQYTIIPISSIHELVKSYREHVERVKYVLLLNIGATFDVVEHLQPDNEATIFIVDSHRPIDVYNIYRDHQVRIITFEEDQENQISIPKYEEMFRDSDSDSDDVNVRDLTLQQLEKRSKRQTWQRERRKKLFEYTQFSFYSNSTALIMFDLAWKLSKDNNELLWLAMIGVSDQFVTSKISKSKYENECKYLHNATLRLKNMRGDGRVLHPIDDEQTSLSSQSNHLNIVYEKDLQLVLYRHWSIYESLRHTMYVACKFKIWKLRGHKHMLGFLAKLGVPLAQCKQKFSSMDLDLRNNIKQWIEELSNEFSLSQIIGNSFNASRGFKNKYNSCDVAHAARALLESPTKDKRNNQKFFDAIDCLSWNNIELLENGFEMARVEFTAILKQVQIMIDSKQIHSMNSQFWHVTIAESTPDASLFCYPHSINQLARFLLHAHASANPKSQKCYELPLVLIVPDMNRSELCLAVGIPPIAADSSNNFFSKAFSQISQKMRHFIFEIDMIDNCIAHFPYNERNNFLNELSLLLT